jgi:GxxExxY protein
MPPGQARMMRVVHEVGVDIMRKMGAGHSEAVYHTAALVSLSQRGLQCRTKVCCPFHFEGLCVGYGEADIVIDDARAVLELKVCGAAAESARLQVAKYARSLGDGYFGLVLVLDKRTRAVWVEVVNAEGGEVLAHTRGKGSEKKGKQNAARLCMDAFRRAYRLVRSAEVHTGVRVDRLVAHLHRALTGKIKDKSARCEAIAAFLQRGFMRRLEPRYRRGHVCIAYPRDGRACMLV